MEQRSLTFDELIGFNIKRLREGKGMSQKKLAESLTEPVSLQQMAKYEKGINRISAQTIFDISNLLHCPMVALFEGIIKNSDITFFNKIRSINNQPIKEKLEAFVDEIAEQFKDRK